MHQITWFLGIIIINVYTKTDEVKEIKPVFYNSSSKTKSTYS